MKLLAIALSIFACVFAVIASGDEIIGRPVTQQTLKNVASIQWQLDNVRDPAAQQAFPKDKPVTITLQEDGKMGGGAPVNRYFGQFTLKDNGVIQWEGPGFGATMMAGPAELMDLEQYYFKILNQCDRLTLNDDRLIFHTHDGKLRLEFKKQ